MNNATTAQPQQVLHLQFSVSMIVVNSFSGVLATVLNLLIIMTFVKTPALRESSANILILSLAVTDILVGTLLQPIYCTFVFSATSNYALDKKLFKVYQTVKTTLINASLFTITAISVDRFLALHLHLRYQEFVTTKRTSMVLIAIWTFSALWGSLPAVINEEFVWVHTAINYLMLLLLLINIGLMLRISRIVRQHSAQIHVQLQNMQPGAAVNFKRSFNIMYFILGTFFLCYAPYICFWIIQKCTGKINNTYVAASVVNTILFMNSAINPIVYFWRIQDMRNAALQLLPWRFFRRQNSDDLNNCNTNSNNIDNINCNNSNCAVNI
ncbi:histamine H2 receptor-like [Exaiptasia diaphana]|uniref:G-protein coupled receptors family 1 profile domain-containing protein n=1 Tax=Exaiptasia diaphana TaxID=2652724 RepID=A0A913XPC3_EXADI|nr:histamine H2 receptor-like [Exaiptasia diaphana]